MNMRSALEVDPQGFQIATEPRTGRLACRRVFLDGTKGTWIYVDDGEAVDGPMSAPKTPFLETEFFRAVIEDRADDAETILAGMMMGERYELDKMLARANKLVNLYRQAHDNM